MFIFCREKKSNITFLQDETVFFVLVLFNDLVYTSTIQKIWLEHSQRLQSNPSSVERRERQLCSFLEHKIWMGSSQPRGAIQMFLKMFPTHKFEDPKTQIPVVGSEIPYLFLRIFIKLFCHIP